MSTKTKTKKSYTPPKIVENENVIGEAALPSPGTPSGPLPPMPAPSMPMGPVAPLPSY